MSTVFSNGYLSATASDGNTTIKITVTAPAFIDSLDAYNYVTGNAITLKSDIESTFNNGETIQITGATSSVRIPVEGDVAVTLDGTTNQQFLGLKESTDIRPTTN